MHRIRFCGLMAVLVLPGVLAAQQPASSANPTTQAAQELSSRLEKWLLSAAEEVPASKLSYKPTKAQMTFGQVWAHLAGEGPAICSGIGGTPAPKGLVPKPTASKQALVGGLKRAFAYCDRVLASADDSHLGDQVDMGFMKGSRALAMMVYVEGLADHYSQVANYMRLNGMLPPSARRSSQ